MKIPHKVRITAKQSYQVVYVDQFDDRNQLGECDFDGKLIVLKRNLSKAKANKIFLHELMHAIEYECGIQIPHKSIYELEDALYKLLRLNKWV